MESQIFKPSEFVALLNQTLEFAYPIVVIEGEVSDFRVSKNRWVYFSLKDDEAKVNFFGSVYQLKTVIEDGMLVKVSGNPKLHPLFGFSVNVQNITPSGEGSLKRAFELLKAKLAGEGLFDQERKREVEPYPQRIGLVTSSQAAAYKDFMKTLNERWGGLEVVHVDTTVQGESAPGEIIKALETLNSLSEPVDTIVVTRGGGSLDDLSAFNHEDVVRAVAQSRAPIIVGIGHEVDVSLAELAADLRAATPTNAAQLVVADKNQVLERAESKLAQMVKIYAHEISNLEGAVSQNVSYMHSRIIGPLNQAVEKKHALVSLIMQSVDTAKNKIEFLGKSLENLNPQNVLARGYSIVSDSSGKVVSGSAMLNVGDKINVMMHKGEVGAEVKDVR